MKKSGAYEQCKQKKEQRLESNIGVRHTCIEIKISEAAGSGFQLTNIREDHLLTDVEVERKSIAQHPWQITQKEIEPLSKSNSVCVYTQN